MGANHIDMMLNIVKRTISDARDINNWKLDEQDYNNFCDYYHEPIAKEGTQQQQCRYIQMLNEARYWTQDGIAAHGIYLSLLKHFIDWQKFVAQSPLEPSLGVSFSPGLTAGG